MVKRLTEQLVTPSTLETAFSTLAEHAAQLIDVYKRQEYALYLIALVLAEKSVVYEYAGELLADCLGKERCV